MLGDYVIFSDDAACVEAHSRLSNHGVECVGDGEPSWSYPLVYTGPLILRFISELSPRAEANATRPAAFFL